MTADARPVAATVDHLTLALRRSGVLGQGRISDVVVEREIKKTRSHTLRLRLSYDGDSNAAPSWLILKTGRRIDGGQTRTSAGRREVAFYREVASSMSVRTVPRCFEALWDETGEWSLLLEDLTDTHVIATEWPLPPATEQCGSIVQVLARFHGAWWDDPRLGRSIGQVCGADDMRRWQQALTHHWERFKARYAGLLTPARGDLLSQVIDRAPDRLARLQGRRNLTIVHGDAHVWNVFMPRNGGDALLIDWENWSVGIATDDLGTLIGAVGWKGPCSTAITRLSWLRASPVTTGRPSTRITVGQCFGRSRGLSGKKPSTCLPVFGGITSNARSWPSTTLTVATC